MIKYLVQDIETVPETEIQDMWEEEQASLAEKGRPSDFPPIWAHKVACIGMLALDEKMMPVKGGCAAGGLEGGKSEREMIQRWSEAASGKLFESADALSMVDWHGRGFDVPVLQTRAFAHGVQLPWYFGLLKDNQGKVSSWSKEYRDRYNGHHMDLAELWTNRGSFQRPHMANLARLMGLPGKIGIDGSQVHQAYLDGKHKEIDIYCMQDVFQTAFIFQRYQYLRDTLNLDTYRAAAEGLLSFIEKAGGHEELLDRVDRAALMIE